MSSIKRTSFRRAFTLAILCVCAGVGVLAWIGHARRVEHARAQFYLLGKALAAYVSESGGRFPADLASLRDLQIVRDVAPGDLLVTADNPDGYPPWAARAPFPVQIDEFVIAWGGVPVDAGGLMIRSRVYGPALRDTARRISEELNRFAREVRRHQHEAPRAKSQPSSDASIDP